METIKTKLILSVALHLLSYTHVICMDTANMVEINDPQHGVIQVYRSGASIVALAQRIYSTRTVFNTVVEKSILTGQHTTDSYQLQPEDEKRSLSPVMPYPPLIKLLKAKIAEYEMQERENLPLKECLRPKSPIHLDEIEGRLLLSQSN